MSSKKEGKADLHERIAQALEDEAIATAAGDKETAERARIEAALLMDLDFNTSLGPKKQ